MEHSKNYEKYKTYYKNGLKNVKPMWSLNMLWNVVGKKTGITEEEYNEITGFVYQAKSKENAAQ